MEPLMRLEHGEEERRSLASDLAPHLHAWLQDSPLLQLEVKENLFQEEKEEMEGEEVKRLETKLRLLAVHSRLLSPLLASFPDKEVCLFIFPFSFQCSFHSHLLFYSLTPFSFCTFFYSILIFYFRLNR